MSYNLHDLVETFTDTKTHEEVADIIYAHSTNKIDVREAALENQSFDSVNSMLDLGCGFGFFTRSLKNKLNSNVSILGIDRCSEYKRAYLNSCNIAGINGNFDGNGVKNLSQHKDQSFDAIICSYAMYFFPEIIPEISRLLKPNGTFITITHSLNHLTELISFIKKTFKELGLYYSDLLPYEKLIRNFTDENGIGLLSKSFEDIEEKDYKSSLVFEKGDEQNLTKYLRFKQPFYIPDAAKKLPEIYENIISELSNKLTEGNTFRITKDDTIYICKNPF